MFFLTGLSILTVGLLAVPISATPSPLMLDPVDSKAPVPRPRSFVSRFLRPEDKPHPEQEENQSGSVPAQLVFISRRTAGRRSEGLLSRSDSCSPETSTVCSGSNGTGLVCSGCSTCCPVAAGGYQCCQKGFKCCTTATGAGSCCPDDGSSCTNGVCGVNGGLRNGAVLESVTVTTTVTSFTASRTVVAVTTLSETITVIDPAKMTQTLTITATSRRNQGRRWSNDLEVQATSVVEVMEASTPHKHRQDLSSQPSDTPWKTGTLTTTVVVPATTTVFVFELTSTITNTIFVTTTVAPSAITTEFTTTTIVVPPSGTSLTRTTFLSPNPPGSTGSILPPARTPGASSTIPASGTSSNSLQPSTSNENPSSTSPTTLISSTTAPSPSSISAPTSILSPTSIPPPSTSTSIESTSTTLPGLPPSPPPSSSLTPDQIAGVVVGVFIFLLLLLALVFLLRWLIRRRRSALATARQQLTPAFSSPPHVTLPGDSTSLSASGLTGENEVRIVIRPPPPTSRGGGRGVGRGQWPMPPGHKGQTYSYTPEDVNTTGGSTPQKGRKDEGDPGTWSIASAHGSPRGTQSGTGTGTQSGSEGGGGRRSQLVSVGWGGNNGSLRPPADSWRGPREGGSGGGYYRGGAGIGKAF